MKNNIHLQRIMISVLTVALVLGVTVCPVSATSYIYDSSSIASFCNDFNAIATISNNYTNKYFYDTLPTTYDDLYNYLVTNYSLNTNEFMFLGMSEASNTRMLYIYGSTGTPYQGYCNTNHNGIVQYLGSQIVYWYSYATQTKATGVISSPYYTSSTVTNATGYQLTQNLGTGFAGFVPYRVTISPSNVYTDTYYYNTYQRLPSSGGGGGGGDVNVGNIGDVNWVNFATMLAAYLGANYTFTVNGTTYNNSYSNVGWCLAYLFECMENPTLQTITLDNTSLDNPVFRLFYGNAQDPTLFDEIKYNSVAINNYLSQIKTLLNEAVYEEDNNIDMISQQLVYLRGDIQDIYDDLYPEDARVINNTMEEEFYDSENGGTSLTEMQSVFSVGTESRDAFDTGASFSLSGLFSFKNDGNWGFWSTQCQNDMDNVPQVRKSENYDSTAYDEQLEELMSIWGLGNNDK